ncbi:hypothetical protein OY671_012687, partial [Metschnikowia pulcherrima]
RGGAEIGINGRPDHLRRIAISLGSEREDAIVSSAVQPNRAMSGSGQTSLLAERSVGIERGDEPYSRSPHSAQRVLPSHGSRVTAWDA